MQGFIPLPPPPPNLERDTVVEDWAGDCDVVDGIVTSALRLGVEIIVVEGLSLFNCPSDHLQ